MAVRVAEADLHPQKPTLRTVSPRLGLTFGRKRSIEEILTIEANPDEFQRFTTTTKKQTLHHRHSAVLRLDDITRGS